MNLRKIKTLSIKLYTQNQYFILQITDECISQQQELFCDWKEKLLTGSQRTERRMKWMCVSVSHVIERSPMTIGTTAAFTPHVFSSSFFNPWYFSHFLCSLFLTLPSLSITTAIFFRYLCLMMFIDQYVGLINHHPFVSLDLEDQQDLDYTYS